MTKVIAARSDSMGDVLLAGPAVRAIAARAEVVLMCGPRGLEAAQMLPGVARILCAELPWIDPEPEPVTRRGMTKLVDQLVAAGADEAVIFTSFHQSPLPLAVLLRMAGVKRISAISEDAYPGSLLDVRHSDPGDVHEVERALSLARAAGFELPESDDARLLIRPPGERPNALAELEPYVVVHPGAFAPARRWPTENAVELVAALRKQGDNVVVTGAPADAPLTARLALAAPGVINLGGRIGLKTLAAVIRDADAIVVGNTGPAHVAAAVGTPVISLFSPVVSAARWHPWRVPHVMLGDQRAACAGSRARVCPVPGHPCLASVEASDVLDALKLLRAAEAGKLEVPA